MPKSLVIVESPTKARTISGFLGPDVAVESSMGHIRDLPRSAAEIPASAKGKDWARLGVDVDNDFEPLYVVPKERKERVKKLKEMLAGVDQLYLATDEDREGESIAWHLAEALKPKVPVHRMVFHEITQHAIEDAFANPRDLDLRLVQAQEARRILDRLYGYEVSPVLWRKVQQGLSAGRVQSVAVRIVVERERERMAFTSAEYWSVEGTFAPVDDLNRTFEATLLQVDGARVATGKEFGADGQAKAGDSRVGPGPGDRTGRRPPRLSIRGAVGRGEAVQAVAVSAISHVDAATGGCPKAPFLVVTNHVGGPASL